jgi:hypothetical protein
MAEAEAAAARDLLTVARNACRAPTSLVVRPRAGSMVYYDAETRAAACAVVAVLIATCADQTEGGLATLGPRCTEYLAVQPLWERARAVLTWLLLSQIRVRHNGQPLGDASLIASLEQQFAQVVGQPCQFEGDADGLTRSQVWGRCSRQATRLLQNTPDDGLLPLTPRIDFVLERVRTRGRAEIALSIALNREFVAWTLEQANDDDDHEADNNNDDSEEDSDFDSSDDDDDDDVNNAANLAE